MSFYNLLYLTKIQNIVITVRSKLSNPEKLGILRNFSRVLHSLTKAYKNFHKKFQYLEQDHFKEIRPAIV